MFSLAIVVAIGSRLSALGFALDSRLSALDSVGFAFLLPLRPVLPHRFLQLLAVVGAVGVVGRRQRDLLFQEGVQQVVAEHRQPIIGAALAPGATLKKPHPSLELGPIQERHKVIGVRKP
jgi:hypothetical protein